MNKSTECSTLTAIAKENSEKDGWKIRYPFTASKAYWSILNSFLGKRKPPNIPPLRVNDFVFSDFTIKATTISSTTFSLHNILLW